MQNTARVVSLVQGMLKGLNLDMRSQEMRALNQEEKINFIFRITTFFSGESHFRDTSGNFFHNLVNFLCKIAVSDVTVIWRCLH